MGTVCPEIDLARSEARNTRQGGDVGRVDESLDGLHAESVSAHLLEGSSAGLGPALQDPADAVALDRAGGDDVGADAVAAQLEGQGLGEGDQAALGGGIGAAAGVAEPSPPGTT
nr:hypothetical protein [Acidiferrimicrobium sp. IK]